MIIICLIFLALFVYYIYSQMPEVQKPSKDENMADKVVGIAKSYFRNYSNVVDSLSDEEFRNIYAKVHNSFDEIANLREEKLTVDQKNKIFVEILKIAEVFGWEFALKHLEYELTRYKNHGLRDDNKGLV